MSPPRFTDAWWGRGASPASEPAHLGPADAQGIQAPVLVQADRAAVVGALQVRRPAYVPDWRPPVGGDAGTALLTLFSEQAAPVLERVVRMPEKQRVELLRVAGVQPTPPTSAVALLEVKLSQAASASVLVPGGLQVGARPANGQGPLVVFETDADLWATPGTIAERYLEQDDRFQALPPEGRFLPLGPEARAGCTLWLGLAAPAAPSPELALGFALAAPAGRPAPVAAGGTAPLPTGPEPVLTWELVDQQRAVRAEVVEDGTGGLRRSGLLRLRTPGPWRPGRPPGMPAGVPRLWLRARVAAGAFDPPPTLEFLKLNMVRALAARTIRDEVLEPVPGGGGRRFRLSQVPVRPETLALEVDEGDVGGRGVPWTRIDDLLQAAREDRVFELDPGSGEVRFGDGLHGAQVPPGFRNVVARRYQSGGGASGRVEADQISTLLGSVPLISGITNPLPASGGTDEESRDSTVLRGPQQLRVRGRAVTLADYELLALQASGAEVRRAHAVAGLHPGLPGRPIPGVVGVLVVPRSRGEGPPVPDQLALAEVARWLSARVAPAGVAVVAGAPRYHLVRVEAQVVLDPLADRGAAVTAVLQDLDRYLDPLEGGEDGQGWPFGGPLRHAPLVRRLLGVELGGRRVLTAVPVLSLVVDGFRVEACADHALPAHDLPWPAAHAIVPLAGRQP